MADNTRQGTQKSHTSREKHSCLFNKRINVSTGATRNYVRTTNNYRVFVSMVLKFYRYIQILFIYVYVEVERKDLLTLAKNCQFKSKYTFFIFSKVSFGGNP